MESINWFNFNFKFFLYKGTQLFYYAWQNKINVQT